MCIYMYTYIYIYSSIYIFNIYVYKSAQPFPFATLNHKMAVTSTKHIARC